MSAVLATLRLARRDAWRHKIRSLLIVAMIAVPVLGLTAADVLARTMQLNSGERLSREIGQADAGLVLYGGRILQPADPIHNGWSTSGPSAVGAGAPAYEALRARVLARLGDVTASTEAIDAAAQVVANDRRLGVNVRMEAFGSPLTHGLSALRSGAAPATTSDVALTPHLARRLAVGIGGTIQLGSRSEKVVGIISDPTSLSADEVYAVPGTVSQRGSLVTVLASTSSPVTWAQVQQLNALGAVVTSREVVEHPPASTDYPVSHLNRRNEVGIETVAIGLAVLEVVLLAGAAFAVGARRQRRDLALLAAAGGGARHVRQVVLAGGVVLGLAGAVIGAPAGILVAHLALPRIARLTDKAPGHFDVRSLEVLLIMVLGLATGIAASLLPARLAARDNVVAALTGRRAALTAQRRVPVVGLVMIVVGVLIAAAASHTGHFLMILTGTVICELGFVACAPTVVGFVGRAGRFVPLAPRLALRDASRHRGRTGPAVAAIMAAIAGTISVSTYLVSHTHQQQEQYYPDQRLGQPVLAFLTSGKHVPTFAQQAADVAVAKRTLGASEAVPTPTLTCAEVDSRCVPVASLDEGGPVIAVGDATLLTQLSGSHDAGAIAALGEGKVVMFAPGYSQHGRVMIDAERSGRVLATAPVYVDNVQHTGASTQGIMAPSTAAGLRLRSAVSTYLMITPHVPSQAAEDATNDQIPPRFAQLYLDRGYQAGRYSAGEIILALVAGLVTLGATGISVGLSMAESKPDLMTLTAIGGRPRTRRLLVANQAGTVALLGALLGVVAGLLPAWAILRAAGLTYQTEPTVVLPWKTILVTVVGIPLLAMAGTALFAGSRATVDRRLT